MHRCFTCGASMRRGICLNCGQTPARDQSIRVRVSAKEKAHGRRKRRGGRWR